jgi:cytochrome c
MTDRIRRGTIRIALGSLLAALVEATIACDVSPRPGRVVTGGDPGRGVVALRAHGCGGCHVVPGLPEARGAVGPSLVGLATRTHIAGRLTNGPLNLMAWIQSPRSIDPGTLMPDLGVSKDQARDIAAYLYSLGPPVPAPRWPPLSRESGDHAKRGRPAA